MKLLALETSTDRGSAALYLDGRVVERCAEGRTSHSEWLLPAVTALLAEAGVALTELDAIAYGEGPGSFTGLRLACGVAQGLSLGSGVPLLPVPSLAALALEAGAPRVLVCVDARMEECYWAAYQVDGDAVQCLLPPAVGAPEALPLPAVADSRWIGAGDGFLNYRGRLPASVLDQLAAIVPDLRPRAGAVARLAAPACAAGRFVDPAEAVPLYVRDKVARTTAERLAVGDKA